jgi:hypothetical protein
MGHPGKRARSNDIYDPDFTTAQQPMRSSGLDTFETKTDDGKTIAGHHFMESPTSSATSATTSRFRTK